MKKNNLLPNELLNFQQNDSSDSGEFTDSEINEKYIRGEVRIVTEQARYPLDSIVTMLESGKYELNPEFQRRFRWSRTKQSRLIESFIMNVPIPPIFLYEDQFSHYEVMDGLQRLTAVFEFYKNQFELEDLEEWPELNGRRYLDLPTQVKRGIDRRYLSSIILLQETAKSEREAKRLKQLVFERINSGGAKLEGQESRNAIYNGPLNKLCIKLSRNLYLCRAWNIPEPTTEEINGEKVSKELIRNERYKKMEDVELVLRFFAFRQRLHHNWGSLTSYLDQYLQVGNGFDLATLKQLESIFEGTIKLVYQLFQDTTFKIRRLNKAGDWEWTSKPSTVCYDSMMYAFSKYLKKTTHIMEKSDSFRNSIAGFYENNSESFAGRDVNKKNFEDRILLYSQFIEEQLSV